LFANNSPVVL